MAETFHGYIETTQDVLLIFEGCRRGLIPRVCRRLQEKERRMIRSGSVFVFDERESGIKRWTDGLVWSPSRILGNFLIYRELDKRVPGDKKLSISSASSSLQQQDSRQRSYSVDQTSSMTSSMSSDRNRERRLVGSLSDSYRFRKDGLIKKTMSIIVNGVAQHLISYYIPNDIISNKLRTPSSVPELASLEISPDLLVKQNFRIPPMVEPPFDQQNDVSLTGIPNGSGGLSPIDNHNPYSTEDRRTHPLRSMSLGSLHRAAPTNYANNIMYTTSSLSQHMDMNDDDATKLSNSNFSAYYSNQQPQQQQQYNTNNGFSSLPSPSIMTISSPNTPILSPVRQSFSSSSQAPPGRHYSMSSTSSGPMQQQQQQQQQQRFNNRNSFDINSIHPHMIPEMTYDQRIKTENSNASPNIGQLLNPVHPHAKSEITHHHPHPHDHAAAAAAAAQQHQQQQQQNTNDFATYGGTYYIQRSQQQQQPLANTHSISVGTNNIVPMFRNGMVFPTTHSNSIYDDSQVGNEFGMEPLMLK